jgi:hypothetical protein
MLITIRQITYRYAWQSTLKLNHKVKINSQVKGGSKEGEYGW